MMPGMNPRAMQQAMRRMGIRQEAVPATEVIIRLGDREIVFPQPEVSKVQMMGQTTWQVAGDSFERSLETVPSISADDVATVVEQTGVDEERARQMIEETKGDLAEAILRLQGADDE